MNNKKLGYIILGAIAIISIIIIAVMGLNVDLRYGSAKQIEVYIGKEFNNNDIKNIAKDVVGSKQIIVRKVETFEDIAQITIKDISEEEAKEITNRIYEKYEVENEEEEQVEITSISNVRIRDIVRPYVLPIGISLAVVLVYAGIRFRKIEILEVLGTILGFNIFAQLLYLCILAIIRLPINVTTVPVGLAIYVIITLVILNDFEKRQALPEKNKKKKN